MIVAMTYRSAVFLMKRSKRDYHGSSSHAPWQDEIPCHHEEKRYGNPAITRVRRKSATALNEDRGEV